MTTVSAINIPSVSYLHDDHLQDAIGDTIENAIVADANSIAVLAPTELSHAMRPRVVRESGNGVDDILAHISRKFAQLTLSGGLD